MTMTENREEDEPQPAPAPELQRTGAREQPQSLPQQADRGTFPVQDRSVRRACRRAVLFFIIIFIAAGAVSAVLWGSVAYTLHRTATGSVSRGDSPGANALSLRSTIQPSTRPAVQYYALLEGNCYRWFVCVREHTTGQRPMFRSMSNDAACLPTGVCVCDDGDSEVEGVC